MNQSSSFTRAQSAVGLLFLFNEVFQIDLLLGLNIDFVKEHQDLFPGEPTKFAVSPKQMNTQLAHFSLVLAQ